MKIIRRMFVTCMVIAFAAALAGGGCFGGGDATTDPPAADLPSDTDDTISGDTVAHLLARYVIDSALAGLGIRGDDEYFDPSGEIVYTRPESCGERVEVPPGGTPQWCDRDRGETAENCPEDCSCGDGVCDFWEGADPTRCPEDCSCGNDICDLYGIPGESSFTCPRDCPPPKCGDGECAHEEYFSGSCPDDCMYVPINNEVTKPLCGDGLCSVMLFRGRLIDEQLTCPDDCQPIPITIPFVHGLPTGRCEQSRQCHYGYYNDDLTGETIAAIYRDFELGPKGIVVDGYTITCVETTYDGKCAEASVMFVFRPEGLEFHTFISGKLYVYREGTSETAPEAYTVVGAHARGTIALPSIEAHQTCTDGACPTHFKYPAVSIRYDDYVAYYLTSGTIEGPSEEVCQSFMIDPNKIRPDAWLGAWWGNPAVLYDDDENGLISCDDPACAGHPFCLISYCEQEAVSSYVNYHGFASHPSCGFCGDGACNYVEENKRITYCYEDCCGNGVCSEIEDNSARTTMSTGFDHWNRPEETYCYVDCCGDDVCSYYEEETGVCPEDCGVCGNGMCEKEKGEDKFNCPQDCVVCGDGVCDIILVGPMGENRGTCPQDCGECSDLECSKYGEPIQIFCDEQGCGTCTSDGTGAYYCENP